MNKKQTKSEVFASFKITLDVSMSVGHLELEDALKKARELKITDILDLSQVEYNDGEIKTTGVYSTWG